MCESPPMTVPAAYNQAIGHTKCHIKVSNNQQTFDANAYVEFHYQDKTPTVGRCTLNQVDP
jgi:hypothetical protein